MGDEELNFTEEEAREWAGDPRNQAQDGKVLVRRLLLCFLLVSAVLLIVWLTSSAGFQHQAAMRTQSGVSPLLP